MLQNRFIFGILMNETYLSVFTNKSLMRAQLLIRPEF